MSPDSGIGTASEEDVEISILKMKLQSAEEENARVLETAEQARHVGQCYKNAAIDAYALLQAIQAVLQGEEVSESMQSFPIVRAVMDLGGGK